MLYKSVLFLLAVAFNGVTAETNSSQLNFVSHYGKVMDTCTGPHEFCCEAPQKDPNNCPDSARTSDCDKKGACCCA